MQPGFLRAVTFGRRGVPGLCRHRDGDGAVGKQRQLVARPFGDQAVERHARQQGRGFGGFGARQEGPSWSCRSGCYRRKALGAQQRAVCRGDADVDVSGRRLLDGVAELPAERGVLLRNSSK